MAKVYVVRDEKFSDAWGDSPYEVDWYNLKIFDTENKAIDYIRSFIEDVINGKRYPWFDEVQYIDRVPTYAEIKEHCENEMYGIKYEWNKNYPDGDIATIRYDEYELD